MVSGFGCQVHGFGFQVHSPGFMVSGFRFVVSGCRFIVLGSWFRASGSWFRGSGRRPCARGSPTPARASTCFGIWGLRSYGGSFSLFFITPSLELKQFRVGLVFKARRLVYHYGGSMCGLSSKSEPAPSSQHLLRG